MQPLRALDREMFENATRVLVGRCVGRATCNGPGGVITIRDAAPFPALEQAGVARDPGRGFVPVGGSGDSPG